MDKKMSKKLREDVAIERETVNTTDNSNLTAIQTRTEDVSNTPTNNLLNTKDLYGNKFAILLDFESFTTIMSFHQSGLGWRIEYRFTFALLSLN